MHNNILSGVPFSSVISLNLTPIKVYQLKSREQIVKCRNQHDFYKIWLITGNNIIRYADREIETKGASLFFCNPNTSYDWEFISEKQKGYACIFSKDFLNMFDDSNFLQQSRLFGTNAMPVFLLNSEQKNFITDIFQTLILEQCNNYIFKEELMYNLVALIVHEAFKIQTTRTPSLEDSSNVTLTSFCKAFNNKSYKSDED